MEKKKQTETFEDSLKKLELIAERLESAELGLDESIIEFEKGMKHAAYCHARLEEAEQKIEILQKTRSGSLKKVKVGVDTETGSIDDDEDIQGSLI